MNIGQSRSRNRGSLDCGPERWPGALCAESGVQASVLRPPKWSVVWPGTPARGRSFLYLCWFVAVAASASSLTPEPQTLGRAREYDLKAAFLYRFVQFISWPDDAFADESAPFVIGVLGHDPFGRSLDGILEGERVGTRPIVLQRFESLEQVKTCHLLYVSEEMRQAALDPLRGLRRHGLLLVGDSGWFAEQGGTIAFDGHADRINLVINTASGRAAGVAISSKLLHLAREVEGLP